ncbi:hypothetical protein ACU4GD_22110 [Cupriavidus basilensis]
MPLVLRLSDLISEGKIAGKRVFIRADLNVPQDDAGSITEDCPHPRLGARHRGSPSTPAPPSLVTSHLGRPDRGRVQARRIRWPHGSRAPGRAARQARQARAELGRRHRRSQPGQAR